MIAVTTSREWVAVPPDRQSIATVGPINGPVEETYVSFLADTELAERFDIRGDWNTQKSGWVPCGPGAVVAVVEEDYCAYGCPLYTYTLVGFAKVAEVRSITDDIPPLDEAPLEIVVFRSGSVIDGATGNTLDLPHASPGGLALRLEPTECPERYCYHGRLIVPGRNGDGEDVGACELCTAIGHPVTVVDLVGEIGRWER